MTDYFDLSRRRFLRTTAVAGAAVFAVPLLGRRAVPGAVASEAAAADSEARSMASGTLSELRTRSNRATRSSVPSPSAITSSGVGA